MANVVILHVSFIGTRLRDVGAQSSVGRSTSAVRARVVVVDDHPFYRDGLIRGLRQSGYIDVVGEAESGREGLELIREKQPDVAVIDYQMPDLDGLAVVQAMVRESLPTRPLLLSALTDSAVVYRALELGAKGYLAKDARRAEIVDAVLRVAKGGTVVPAELAVGLADQIRLRADTSGVILSEREQQVLHGFARGQSIPELAAELFLAPSTVKTHTQRLYEKLGVSDRAAAVAEGMRRGLLE
jgi:two-component system, NarL family, nitrate/nitrite response regulator NarL